VLAAPPNGTSGSPTTTGAPTQTPATPGSSNVTTSGGTAGTIPYFSTATDIENSAITQTGSGSSAKVGINNTSPSTTLDVKGNGTVRGTLSLPPIKTATTTQGYNSQPLEQSASVYNTGAGAAIAQNFQWQAEPVGNNTATTSGTLNLLYSTGANKLAETGLNIASDGQITFAKNQTFPGTGTITGVTTGSGLSGGGASGNVTLTNTGLLGLTGGSGISVGSGQSPTVSNTGILTLTHGTGISLTSGQNPTIGINTSVVPELGAANI
jgi:hypothetical protein